MDSETVRIRLIFEEGRLLSKPQRKNGLKRSWILLKSYHHTISDFSSYLLDFFLLRSACPDGLILSMDGFVLPPFEPTSVLKDKDIVRVKKKEDNVTAVDKVAYMAEGQSADIDVQLQANEELVKDGSDYRNEADEDEPYDLPHQLEDTVDVGSDKKIVCRKRKALKTPHSSKMKKNRSAPTAKCLRAPSNLQQIHLEHNQRFQRDVILSEKSPVKKHKSSNGHTVTDDSNKKNASKLKKDKKQMMRKQDKAQKEKLQKKIVEKSNSKLPDENYFEDSEQLAGISDDEEIVPVVVRPGHVRFLPPGQVEANQFVHPAETSMDTSWLNRITIKKGQKWGKGKYSSWRSNCRNCEGPSSTPQVKKDFATVNCPLDFDKLRPCASLPKGGDIIAYRLIDLSSSWTPELSSFRVGKVSWCKPEANKIMLIPVPEYPFVFKKAVNEVSATQVGTSPYAEDGSLKADYSSLVDIRIVGCESSTSFEAAANKISEVPSAKQSWNKWKNHSSAPKQSLNKWENHSSAPKQSLNKWENRTSAPKRSGIKWENHTSARKRCWNKSENHTSAQENGKENAWDEILQAWSAKKTNLSKEVRWNRADKKAQEGAHGSW